MKTLIVEDSATLCAIYSQYLDGSGLEVTTVETLADAKAALVGWHPHLVLLDIELPDGNGLDLLNETVNLSSPPAVVVMTGHGEQHAEQAIQRGAADFLTKPFDASRLRVTLRNAAEKLTLSQQVETLAVKRESLGPLMGSSSAMQSVYETVESLAGTLATAFIMGESGTGKELAARAIHQLSARAPGPFIVVDCASLATDQLERALFGTDGEVAQGLVAQAAEGTLFLDEVCSLGFASQATLLRLIQHGTYRPVGSAAEATADVRIIASTNRDPLFEMREGRLREDLYYRLHVVPLRMPAMRERSDDILMLAKDFLDRIAHEEEKDAHNLSDPGAQALRGYSWPGNVRQLENTMRQLLLTSTSTEIDESAIHQVISVNEISVDNAIRSRPSRLAESAMEPSTIQPLWMTEKKTIEEAIAACDGSINRAAQYLEVAPSTIYRKLQSWKAQNLKI